MQGIINESMDGTGIRIRSDIDDAAVSDAKYRFLCNTLKEGISNGLRHGGATAFWFELKQTGKKLEFLLSDNGSGVEINKLKEGFGLTACRAAPKAWAGTSGLFRSPTRALRYISLCPRTPAGIKGYERGERKIWIKRLR